MTFAGHDGAGGKQACDHGGRLHSILRNKVASAATTYGENKEASICVYIYGEEQRTLEGCLGHGCVQEVTPTVRGVTEDLKKKQQRRHEAICSYRFVPPVLCKGRQVQHG